METKERIEETAKFAKGKKEKAISEKPEIKEEITYRWEHTLRVVQYGKSLAEVEDANMEIVIVACLLHDIAKLNDYSHDVEHGRIGAKIARPFLRELRYAREDVENICFSIAWHVDGKADFEHPLTLEAQIVSDADKIDRFSGYRIMRALQASLKQDYDDFVASVENQLVRLQRESQRAFVQTESGKKIFDQQISLQRSYLKRLVADHEMTALPEF